ncbi:MAG: hypothetical protein EFT35_05525 [Methanophagales archaeon ANME-1-THS]|nr:MAG: hypothetical protein EFT35_05525 [Methanophagales archaeon ANME-1-THS]
MKIRKLGYTLALILLSSDSISSIMASAFYDEFAELNPLYKFLGDLNPLYLYLVVGLVMVIVLISFLTALSWTDRSDVARRGVVILSDFCAVYLLTVGLLTIPHNTLVLIGSPGIIVSTKMLQRLKAASVILAGIIVVILDRRRLVG